MDWGLKNRISQIIKPHDNRALMLAVDHGEDSIRLRASVVSLSEAA